MAEELEDSTRRRRVACKLLKGIAANYKEQVTSIVSAQIQNLLNSYALAPGLVKNDAAAWASSDLAPGLINNLFNALKLPESEENQYIIKCIMRVIGVAETNRGDMAVSCIIGLTSILNVVCKNPPKESCFQPLSV